MIYETTCNGAEIAVEFEAQITYKGRKSRPANFDSPGEPEEPMEYEIKVMSVVDEHGNEVELSPQDMLQIVVEMMYSHEVYNQIAEELGQ